MYLCSLISFKRSRRELFIDVAEDWYILKNYQNTSYLRFSFTSKAGLELSETEMKMVLFLQC